MGEKIRETLEKQLELLSERSKSADDRDLAKLTGEMVGVAVVLRDMAI